MTYSITLDDVLNVILEDTYTSCNGNQLLLDPNNDTTQIANLTYLWSTGETTPFIIAFNPGPYTCQVTNVFTGCTNEVSTEVIIGDNPSIGEGDDLTSCEPNATFDLTVNEALILNGLVLDNYEIGYYDNASLAFQDGEPIQDPTNYSPGVGVQPIFVRLEDVSTGCFSVSEFQVENLGNCPIVFPCASGKY